MEKLREWFELTGVTHGQLASELGVTRMTIHNWLTGKSAPGGFTLRKLHELTRIPLEDLVPRETA